MSSDTLTTESTVQVVTLTLPARKRRLTHAQSRERNEQFANIVRELMSDQAVAEMKKSRLMSYLRETVARDHNIQIPLSAAYKVMASIDERFEPKRRTRIDASLHVEAE